MKRSTATGLGVILALLLTTLVAWFIVGVVLDRFMAEPGGDGLDSGEATGIDRGMAGPARGTPVGRLPGLAAEAPAGTEPGPVILEPDFWSVPFRFRLVDRSGLAVPGARIRLTSYTQHPGPTFEAISDEEGRAEFAARGPAYSAEVHLRGQDVYGSQLVVTDADRGRELVLVLGRGEGLAVRVVDQAGRGRGGIGLLLVRPLRRTATIVDELKTIAISDQEGRASLPIPKGFPAGEARIELDLPLLALPASRVEVEPLPAGETLVVLPATGAFEFRPGESMSALVTTGSRLAIRAEVDGRLLRAEAALEDDGFWRFPCVEPGLRWHAALQLLGPEDQWLELPGMIAGPRQDGDTVEAMLDAEPSGTLVRLRLLGADGRAAAGIRFDVRPLFEHERPYAERGDAMLTLRADAEGRVAFRLAPRYLRAWSGEPLRGLRFAVWSYNPVDAGAGAHGDVPLPEGEREGMLDLGELRLERWPLLVAGRVVDAVGEPIAGARVGLTIDHVGDEFGYEDMDDAWESASFRCAADGSFSIHQPPLDGAEGDGDGGRYLLLADAPGHRRMAVGFLRSGTRDLVIRMEPAAALEIEFLLDPGWDLDWFRPWASGPALALPVVAGEIESGQDRAPRELGGGRFRLDSVGQGQLELGLGCHASGERGELWARMRRRVEIRAEDLGRAEPLRLTADFRGLCGTSALRVVDDAGRGLSARLRFHCFGASHFSLQTSGDGSLLVPELFLAEGFSVSRPGYWTRSFAGVPRESRIELEAAAPVVIVALDQDGRPFAESAKPTIHGLRNGWAVFDPRPLVAGEAAVEIEDPGELRLVLGLTAPDGSHRRHSASTNCPAGTKRLEVRFGR
ncbi:MAG: hypothetical protein H6807_17005 [Planctomycetes bacterium]|nr:hypothetical protein [Planctomycetota bacterium]